jgi:hypothetical protein
MKRTGRGGIIEDQNLRGKNPYQAPIAYLEIDVIPTGRGKPIPGSAANTSGDPCTGDSDNETTPASLFALWDHRGRLREKNIQTIRNAALQAIPKGGTMPCSSRASAPSL